MGTQGSISDGELQPFRRRARQFLDEHATPLPEEEQTRAWGVGSDAVVASGLAPGRHEPEDLAAARAFQRALFDAGLAWLTGPVHLGGGGLTPAHVAAYRALAGRYRCPDTGVFMIGQQIVAPAIAAFGGPAQQQRWLRALWRGDAIGCQLFSEPEAGSDLASLRTRTERSDGGWLLHGQKVWSSGAHLSDVGEVLVRTDPDVNARHRGLTMFLLDMRAPGVTVRPLRQMNGNAHFNEVFLDAVFVPDDARLGELGQGWAVANASLSSERDLSHDDAGLFLNPVGRFVELADRLGAAPDPVVRQQVAAAVTRDHLARWGAARLQAAPHPAGASMLKLAGSDAIWRLAQDAASVLGPDVAADGGGWGRYAWSGLVLGAHSQRIAGGTDEIQRNLIAERGLGLPREPRPDHTAGALIPFPERRT
ncbi:MAG: acyl-CoA dehydrogenase family protein [Acidimicrobiales bacterium]